MSTCSCCGRERDVTVTLHNDGGTALCATCVAWLAHRMDHAQAAVGGWRAVGHEPVFAVRDISSATDHYRKLGFTISHHDDTYAFAHRDRDLTIHLALVDGTPQTSELYVHCADADAVAAEWRLAGMTVEGPEDKEWGKREGRHVDLDGNVIRFGSPLDDEHD